MKRVDLLIAAIVFLLTFGLYLATICPTIHLGDSGELNLAAATLGIPHVPGYPLMVTLAHAVTFLPTGNGAFKGNLFAALTAGAACALFYLLLLRLFSRRFLAVCFAFALAGGFTFWEQSLKIRTYPLYAALTVSVILMTLKWRENHDRRWLYALALMFGLGLGNHEILLCTAAVVIAAFVADFSDLKFGQILAACGFGLLGLTIYGYLPLRAIADPVLNWGDPSSFGALKDVLLQAQYHGKMMNPDWGPKIEMIRMIGRSLMTEFGPWVFALGAAGSVFTAIRSPVLFAGLLGTVAINIGLRINYIGQDEFFQVLRYMMATFIALLIFGAYCSVEILKRIESASWPQWTKGSTAFILLIPVAISPALINASRNDLSGHRVAYDYAQSLLAFPENDYALAVGGDNNVFPLWYMTRFERMGETTVVLPQQGFRAEWLADELAEQLPPGMTAPQERYVDLPEDMRFYSTLNRLIENDFPVYSLFDTTEEEGGAAALQDMTERYGLTPCGMALRFDEPPLHCDPGSELWYRYAFDSMAAPGLYRDHHTSQILENAAVMLGKRGVDLSRQEQFPQALASLDLAHRILPNDPWPLMNLANALARSGRPAAALDIYDELVIRFPEEEIYRHNRAVIRKVVAGESRGVAP
jgi:tetratricopeptide (TPR) repeat protein